MDTLGQGWRIHLQPKTLTEAGLRNSSTVSSPWLRLSLAFSGDRLHQQ